ncbi:MAG TPA: radical SAM protein [Candidatus Paceibacterota bacterium]|nr:radical SAM protein [Candidatus Paceibacterota bacterium]
MSFRVARELFVVPHGEDFILYEPFRGAVVKVTASVIASLQRLNETGDLEPGPVRETLIRAGVLVPENSQVDEVNQQSAHHEAFAPTAVTLFPTFDCNLRCVYCYSNAGVRTQAMSRHVADAAIRTIVDNAIKRGTGSISLGFHGGGEPFFGPGWLLMRHAVKTAKSAASQHGLKLTTSSATNGVLNEEQLGWLCENLDSINLSWDGPPDIQDAQRPLANGSGSSTLVERTARFLTERNYRFGIRSTVTRASVNRLPELVGYFRNIAPTARIHLEPLFECGRCLTTKTGAPEYADFAQAFLDLCAARGGEEFTYSGTQFGFPKNRFCGACGDNFVISPFGDVTSCFEVSHSSDPLAKIFFLGKYDVVRDSFTIDESRRQHLRSRTVQRLPHCTDCIAKYSCAGDCPAHAARASNLFDASVNPRCTTNQQLFVQQLAQRVTAPRGLS